MMDECIAGRKAQLRRSGHFVVLDVDRIRLVAESSERGRRKVVWSETRGGTVVVGNVV